MSHGPQNTNSHLIQAFRSRPVAYNPFLAVIAGSATAGLLMSQLLYWYRKGANPDWFYKTIDEMWLETHLTRSQQETAIRIWKNLSVIEVRTLGMPPKRHFKICLKRLLELMGDEKNLHFDVLDAVNKLNENRNTERGKRAEYIYKEYAKEHDTDNNRNPY